MARQIGGVVGIAVLVAILEPTAGLSQFQAGWAFMAASALAAGAVALLVPGIPLASRTAPARGVRA
jgi:hypothetical protein